MFDHRMQPLRDLLGLVLVPGALFVALLAPDYRQELPVERYEDGVTPLYLDRPYVNTKPHASLEGLRVVRIPRHLHFDVWLDVAAPARVIRLVCEKNDDAIFSRADPVTGLSVRVEGRSCVFTAAAARQLPAGLHALTPGEPVAAAPILVATDGPIRATTTSRWNKLTPGADPLDFVLRNKRKLAALGMVYVACAWVYWRVRARWGRKG
jgi:hypothetical protein